MNNRSEFDAYGNNYSETVNRSISFSGLKVDFFAKAKASRFLDLLSKKVGDPKQLSILDVGCGVGTYHPLLKDKVGKITGIDLSEESLKEGRAKNPSVEYLRYDGLTMPFPDESFDASFAICVMHHVPPEQWSGFSKEMRRVTRRGGLVVVFEHNPFNPLTLRAVNNCPFDANAVLLAKSKTEVYLKEAGLCNVSGRYILSIPSIGGIPRKLDDLLGTMPTGAQYFVFGTP